MDEGRISCYYSPSAHYNPGAAYEPQIPTIQTPQLPQVHEQTYVPELSNGEDSGQGEGTSYSLMGHDFSTLMPPASKATPIRAHPKKRRYYQLCEWSEDELRAIEMYLGEFLSSGKVPEKRDCKACLKNWPELFHNKKWYHVQLYAKSKLGDLSIVSENNYGYNREGLMLKNETKDQEDDDEDEDSDDDEEQQEESEHTMPQQGGVSQHVLDGSQHTVEADQTLPLKRTKKPGHPRKRKMFRRVEWSRKERKIVEHHFSTFLKYNLIPGKKACQECVDAFPYILKNRRWTHIKFYIKNKIAYKEGNNVQTGDKEEVNHGGRYHFRPNRHFLDLTENDFDFGNQEGEKEVETHYYNMSDDKDSSDDDDPEVLRDPVPLPEAKPIKKEMDLDEKRPKFKRLQWSPDERRIVDEYFSEYIRRKEIPGKVDCEACLDQYPEILKRRRWTHIKFHVRNKIVTLNATQKSVINSSKMPTDDRYDDQDPGLLQGTRQVGDMMIKDEVEDVSEEERTNTCRSRKKRKFVRRPWSQEEIRVVEEHLKAYLKCGKLPGKKECEACIDSTPEILKHRNWTHIKFFIKNRLSSMK